MNQLRHNENNPFSAMNIVRLHPGVSYREGSVTREAKKKVNQELRVRYKELMRLRGIDVNRVSPRKSKFVEMFFYEIGMLRMLKEEEEEKKRMCMCGKGYLYTGENPWDY
jgi:hypothetical protein